VEGESIHFFGFLSHTIFHNYASAYTPVRNVHYHLYEVMDMTVKDAVALRFQGLCQQRKLRPNQLATLSGVTPSTVYSMLDPTRRDVSIVTIKKLCDGLDLSLADFFSGPEFDGLEQEIR
jgi:DNA-binding Xre family transcriptional regulator